MGTFDVYRVLWRRKLFIVVLTAIVGAVAWFAASQQPKTYEATALVRVQQKIAAPDDAYGSLVAGSKLAQTYARIVTTRSIEDRVAADVAKTLGPTAVNLSARPVDDVELLQITATSRSPRAAAAVANSATRILRTYIADTGTLRDQLTVVDAASAPSAPSSPRVTLIVVLAVLLGLLVNCALALIAEYLADRLPDPAGVESALGAPVLATIPNLSFPKVEPRPNLSVPVAQASPAPAAPQKAAPSPLRSPRAARPGATGDPPWATRGGRKSGG